MEPIYLDHNATTPLDERVLQAMLPYLRQHFGNASSRQHAFGQAAAEAVERARGQAAALIGCDEREIVFTSGATESSNLAIKGAVRWLRDEARRGHHIVSSSVEHSSVEQVLARLEREGYEVTRVDPLPSGVVDVEAVAAGMRPETAMVSVMWANNEVGVVNDLPALGAVCKSRGVVLHTDATQIVGKLPVNVYDAGVDLLSFSAHKLYGPKGAGALYVRRKGPRVRLEATLDGGGHERGMRSGTLNVPGIVGMGEACAIAGAQMAGDAVRIGALRDGLERELIERIGGVRVQGAGPGVARLPGTSHVMFPGVDGERMMARMPEVACSSGSACTTAAMQTSYVLRRMGMSEAEARSCIRFGLGRSTSEAEVRRAVVQIVQAYEAAERTGAGAGGCGV